MPPRWQPHLAVEGLAQLVLDVESLEQRHLIAVHGHLLQQVGLCPLQVLEDTIVRHLFVDHQALEIPREVLTDHPRDQRWLLIEQGRCGSGVHLGLDPMPDVLKPGDVGPDVLAAGTLGGSSHDHTHALGAVLGDQLTKTAPLVVWQALRDTAYAWVGGQHQVAAGKAHLVGQAGALVAHGVLDYLHQHRVARS